MVVEAAAKVMKPAVSFNLVDKAEAATEVSILANLRVQTVKLIREAAQVGTPAVSVVLELLF